MDQTPIQVFALVIPIFNDWASVQALLDAIDQVPLPTNLGFHVILVNDGSYAADQPSFGLGRYRLLCQIETVNLVCNLGHQRAIAVGLVAAAELPHIAGVIVMDGDGEDRPEDIRILLNELAQRPSHIVCARRRKRSESWMFRASYRIYKAVFQALTGKAIDFGNFCVIPRSMLNNVIHNPATWNHLAASILRSRVPVIGTDTTRGFRFAGESKMNYVSLILHGMSAISVYAEVVMVRMVLATLGVAGLTVLGMVAVAAVRLFTHYAVPGWASTVFGSLTVILLQSIVFATVAAFMLLNARSVKPVIPALDAMQFVESRDLASPNRLPQQASRLA
jgi:hypothetical protein